MSKATRIASISLGLLFLCGRALAAAVFALYTPQGIVIGSDSKIVALNGPAASYGCKIHVSGRVA
jgi:hypothetical protein